MFTLFYIVVIRVWYILPCRRKHIYGDICLVENITMIFILPLWIICIIYKHYDIYKACLLTKILINTNVTFLTTNAKIFVFWLQTNCTTSLQLVLRQNKTWSKNIIKSSSEYIMLWIHLIKIGCVTHKCYRKHGKGHPFPLWSCRHIMQHTKLIIFNKVPNKQFRILILLCPIYKCSVLKSIDLPFFNVFKYDILLFLECVWHPFWNICASLSLNSI